MKLTRSFWLQASAVLVAFAALGAASSAHARGDVYWSIGVSSPGVAVGVGNAYPYVAPAPVYVAPAPVYVAPAPVYVPPPAYVYPGSYYVRPAPVYYSSSLYYAPAHRRHKWKNGHRHW